MRIAKGIFLAGTILMLGVGCGVTCTVGGTTEDFANCDDVYDSWEEAFGQEPGRARALQACLEEECGLIFQLDE